MQPILVMLGAGSASFTMAILQDILLNESLQACTFRMVDIDEGRLLESKRAAEKYRREAQASIRIEAYTDRQKALPGADFVLCAVKIGGYEPLEKERQIAQDHGYYRGIGDRVSCYFGGIGAFHQIRFLEALARDMQTLCPDAVLIQTANPVLEGTNYLTRYTSIRAVGVCHGHFHAFKVAKIIGLDPGKVSAEMVGFNHQIFLTDFRYEGKDAYPLLDRWIEEGSKAYWQSDAYLKPGPLGFVDDDLSPGAIDAYRLYGRLPIGDAVRSATPWWHHVDLASKEKWYGPNGGFDSEICWPRYLKQKDDHHQKIQAVLRQDSSMTEAFPLVASQEQHIPLIAAMVADRYKRFTLNIPNEGCLPGIPDDVMVEIPAVASARGVQGLKMKPLPRRILDNVLLPRMRTLNNLHEAYRQKDRSLLVWELMHDPRTHSFEQARKLIDTLLAQPWNAAADHHYR